MQSHTEGQTFEQSLREVSKYPPPHSPAHVSIVQARGGEGLQWWLAVVLSRHVFEGSEAVAPRHVLLELLLQGLQADPVLLVGAELGDVEAGRVRHVDHVGVGQNHKLILL